MKKSSIIILALPLAAALFLVSCGSSSSGNGPEPANGYPEESIEVIVPYAAGGASDGLSRALAKAVKPSLSKPLVVVNRGGAAGTIGVTGVANAEPDGYTMLITTEASMAVQPVLRETQYSLEDFRGIVMLAEEPHVLAVREDSPWQTLDDLANSDERIEYGHAGVGGFPQLVQAAFFNEAGVQAEGIPFDGSATSLKSLLGGQVDIIAGESSIMMPQIDSGELRPLAVSSPKRLDYLPDVPTLKEKGYNDATIVQSWAAMVPSDTPDEHVKILREAFSKAIESSEYQTFIDETYRTIPKSTSGEQWLENIKSEQDETAQLLERLDIRADGE